MIYIYIVLYSVIYIYINIYIIVILRSGDSSKTIFSQGFWQLLNVRSLHVPWSSIHLGYFGM